MDHGGIQALSRVPSTYPIKSQFSRFIRISGEISTGVNTYKLNALHSHVALKLVFSHVFYESIFLFFFQCLGLHFLQ
jgi:hypothetical protein